MRLEDGFITVEIDGKEYVIDKIAHKANYTDAASSHLCLICRDGGEGEIKKMMELVNETLTKEEKKLLLELIGNEQIHMILKNNEKYKSEKYRKLEELKMRINDM